MSDVLLPNAPPMKPVEKWRVYGYTAAQLRDSSSPGEVSGWTRDSEARALEMAANLMAGGAKLIVLQVIKED